MARRRERIDDEQKSYSMVFLLAVGLLLIGAVWAVWDDNISRRPWKKYQVDFSELQIERAKQAVADEDARLAQDPKYQDVSKQLNEAQASIASGETGRQLDATQAAEAAAKVHVDEYDLQLRIVKSKIEEAWYAYDHAMLSGDTDGAAHAHAHLDALQQEKQGVEASLAKATAQMQQYTSQAAEMRSVVENLDKQKHDLEKQRDQLQQKLEGIVLLKIGPLDLPKIPKIQQVVLNEFDRNAYDQPVARVDRCTSCHAGVDKVGFDSDPQPFATHPARDVLLSKHPTDKFGCTPCHGGQGAAVNAVDMAHGEVKFWEHPLLRGDMVQAGCPGCHTNLRLPHADQIAKGEMLFEQLGCVGCHLVQGYGDLPKPAPFLRRISAKVNPQWLAAWIENPQAYRPHTRMPNFMFSKEKATAIAAYIWNATQPESQAWLSEHGAPPAAIDPTNAQLVAHGKELADSLGCRGCHGFAPEEAPARLGKTKDIAPNLSNIAAKTDARWIYHWIKNPRGYSPEARMPSLRLSDDEAIALTSYLLTLGTPSQAADVDGTLQSPQLIKDGEALVRKYGCAGCHNIPGMEQESRIGVELSTFGQKPLEELFFGNHPDTPDVANANDPKSTFIPHTWYDWAYNKVKTPRTYETERIEQLMPQFSLDDEDIRSVLVFLKSRTDHKTPNSYKPTDSAREQKLVAGRRIVERYNCIGCHVIEGRGGAIRAFYKEAPTLAPPLLNGEGAKVQPDWLYGFIQQPIPLRPWLKVRMPTFGLTDVETNAVVEYFLAQDKIQIPFVYVNDAALPNEYVDAGKALASPEVFNCFSCHQRGEIKPEGPPEGWAPDLALARHRLNPDWILAWIRNPQALMPGTKMPQFFNVEDDVPDGPEDVLGGNEPKQIEALRDYVLTLHKAAEQPAPAPPPAAAAQSAQAGGEGGDQQTM
jgi:mono/diheme cytochrome c family protein